MMPRSSLFLSTPLLGVLLLAGCVPPPAPAAQAPQPVSTAPTPTPTARGRWQPAAVITNARTVAAQTYVVRSGDTLSEIAEESGAPTAAIARANGLAAPYRIFPGQRLTIPGGRYHRVNRGETGIAIALAYGVDWDAIVAANDLRPPYVLRVGQTLVLPGDAPPQRAEPAKAEAAPTQMAAFDIDIDDIISGGTPARSESSEPARPRADPAPFDGSFSWPVQGRVISAFGAKAGGLYNDGINIAADKGTPVRAAASGTVIYAGNGVKGWGNLVLVKHSDRWVTAYAHNDAFYVERGDTVGRGEVIAEVGATGSVDKPQLHFELREGRRAVDPRAHLPAV